MSIKLHAFDHGRMFIQAETNSVQYYQGRKFIVVRHITSHAKGGTYLFHQTMIRQQPGRFTTIPGSGMNRELSSPSAFSGHMEHVTEIRAYHKNGSREFVATPF